MARQMKESGIEWIGEIPADWNIGKVGYFYDIQLGKMLQPTKEFEDDTLEPYLCAANVGGNRFKLYPTKEMWFNPKEKSKYCVSNGDLLVVEGGDIASCDIVSECNSNFYIQNALHRVRTKKGNDNRFLKYWLWFVKSVGYIDLICNKATIAHFSKEKFISLPYIITAKNERVIADYLDKKCSEVDAVMLKTKATIEEYKKLKQSVIAEAVTNGIRNNRVTKHSGIEWAPEIPGDWSVIPSKFMFRNSDERKHDGDVLLTSSQKYGIISQTEYMERENAKIVLANKGLEDWKHVEPYDFIISLRSFQGGLEMSETAGCITWHYIVLKPCREVYSNYYKWLFKSEVYIKSLQRTCNFIRDGQDLRYSNFVQVPLVMPPLDEQKEIADYLDKKCAEIDTLIAKKKALLEELEAYKKSVIYEYVTGKKEVQ